MRFSLHTGGMLTEGMLAAYLARIGVPGPLALDAEALRGLHQAALLAAYRDHFGIDLTSVPEPAAGRDLAS